MSAAGARGLRATYHRVLDKVELMLPEKLRPLYNHPAGNGPRMAPTETFPLSPSKVDPQRPADRPAAGGVAHSPHPFPASESARSPVLPAARFLSSSSSSQNSFFLGSNYEMATE
ncbi:hypothetical protein HPG69_005384 [Diceros bicornis minor]|uniref:Uncharacterized protein n=1 Tax=Diceros bicornis minor TaxID=77932 RepID=A0A7J7ELE7_DICBM|nr:hypothetical protein HPG69_005384 [Diceros bicornis minor]